MYSIKLIPDLIRYEVDEAMLGGEWDSDKYSLSDFCYVLQKLCEERCLFFEIIPIRDSWNGANHLYEDPDYSSWRMDYLGDGPRYEYGYDMIPWMDALERYFEEYERGLLSQITDEDLTEVPEKLREAIITKRDHPGDFTREHYQNIYHNLLHKDVAKFEKMSKKYSQKAKLARILQEMTYMER